MKARNLLLATAVTASGLIVACSKNNNAGTSGGTTNGTTPAQVQAESDDVTQVSNEMDAMNTDVNNSLNASTAFSGASYNGDAVDGRAVVAQGGGGSLILDYGICDATVTTDTANGLRQIIITYNGLNCWGNRTRTGVVVTSIPVGVRWRDSGAVV